MAPGERAAGRVTERIENGMPNEMNSQEPLERKGRAARIAATALVAAGALVLLFAAAAVLLVLIGELLRGDWMLAGSAVVVLVGLYLLAKRFVKVAANQNKDPLG